PEEREVLSGSHRDYYLWLAERAEREFQGQDQAYWFDRLEREHDNLRAALRWCVEKEITLRLAGALWRFWHVRGHLQEGRSWLEGALARRGRCSEAVRAKALNAAGNL